MVSKSVFDGKTSNRLYGNLTRTWKDIQIENNPPGYQGDYEGITHKSTEGLYLPIRSRYHVYQSYERQSPGPSNSRKLLDPLRQVVARSAKPTRLFRHKYCP